MYIPDEDHVMRYVSYNRLEKDEDGNPTGDFLPQAFELRKGEKGLSVNWLEYFKGPRNKKIESSVRKFRETISVGKTSAFGISNVKKILDICVEYGANKVRVLLEEEDDNKSHSVIVRLPQDDEDLCESLAVHAFVECVFNLDIKYLGSE